MRVVLKIGRHWVKFLRTVVRALRKIALNFFLGRELISKDF